MTPREAFMEAEKVGPKPELEAIIAPSHCWSYDYAHYVLDGRFELGEAAIATNAECSYLYAKYVLGDRFELGEAALALDPEYWELYIQGDWGMNDLWSEFTGRVPV